MKKIRAILIVSIFIIFESCSKNKDMDDPMPIVPPINSTPPSISSSTAPNIIFIIADDLGWDVFGNYPNITGTKASTPTIDSLARNGVTFTNFWVNPECAPSRAAMLSGKFGFRTGVGSAQGNSTLPSTETIIHKYINDKTANSYATAAIGKWHISPQNQLSGPENFGVQYYSGFLPAAINDYYNWTETSGGKQQTITTYTTTQFVDKSVAWIKQQAKPFFLWLAFNAPHTPFHRPPLNLIKNQALVNTPAAINANQYTYYLAAIEAMDKEIARLISSLTPIQKENTVFIFVGDNGTPSQVSQAIFKANGTKGTLFQGGINTPLIVSGKNITRKNVIETALVHAPDMFPTIADIAGTGIEKYQGGVSIKPLFTDGNATKRTFIYSDYFSVPVDPFDGYSIRNDKYKLISLKTGTELLFNLGTDPFEKTNLLSGTLTPEAKQNLESLKVIKNSI